MTRLVMSGKALADMDRLCKFLLENMPEEAVKTGELVLDALMVLENHPAMGRPVGNSLRELVISRGRTGYLALYGYDQGSDSVTVLALRHQRECGWASM